MKAVLMHKYVPVQQDGRCQNPLRLTADWNELEKQENTTKQPNKPYNK
jgi:hypothetical protein